jgi:hypothetical protein
MYFSLTGIRFDEDENERQKPIPNIWKAVKLKIIDS